LKDPEKMTTAHPILAAGAGAAPHLPSTASSSSGSESGGGDEEWDDWADQGDATGDGEGDDDAAASLFDPAHRLPSVPAALAHDASAHAFDLIALRRALRLGDHGTFQLINWVRTEVGAGRDPRPAVRAAAAAAAGGGGGRAASSAVPWADARFLVPHLADDALLCYDYDEEDDEGGGEAQRPASAAAHGGDSGHELSAARAEAAALRAALVTLAAVSLPPDAAAALPPAVLAALEEAGWEGGDAAGGGTPSAAAPPPPTKPQPPSATATAPPAAHPGAANVAAVDRGYFGGYAGLGIHRTMLGDAARTATYRAALEENPGTVKGKVVLDVGCGTGVLSLFAARGGAAAVVGVEGAAPMAALARAIVAANGLSADEPAPGAPPGAAPPGPVSIIHARVEDLIAAGPLPLPNIAATAVHAAPPTPTTGHKVVDVIVSEWMGYALFFECMLDSVLAARDAWLKPGGVLLPDTAAVHIAGLSPSGSDLDFWGDVHGLDLSAAAEAVRAGRRAGGAVLEVGPHHVVTSPATVLSLDLLTATPGDAEFSTTFCVEAVAPPPPPAAGEGGAAAAKKPATTTVTVGSVALWFDVAFSRRACPDSPQVLCTGPASPQTHWHQAVLELDSPLTLSVGGGDGHSPTHLRGRLSMARGAEHRSVDISLECEACVGVDGPAAVGTKAVRLYTFAMSD